jgi:hypothetical protein
MVLRLSRGVWAALGALALLPALSSGCGSSSNESSSLTCAQSVTDYCKQAPLGCVYHIALSSDVGATESSFCTQCGTPCKAQIFSFEDCADGSLAVATQVGAANASKGVEVLTYLYDASTLQLTAVLDSTTGGTYKASLTCVGGAQTLASHGACAAYILPFTCP